MPICDLSFTLRASSVAPLGSPCEYYDALLAGVATATSRITLSSLYVGTGEPETALILSLRARLLAVPALRVHVHCDLARTLRGTPPPAEILLKLTRGDDGLPDAALAARVRVGLTLMPQLRQGLGARLPPRFREALGVWHAKAAAFDSDTVIFSGANLSADYFTNRQDRYVRIHAFSGGSAGADAGVGELAQYVHGVIDDVASLRGSHYLTASGAVNVVGGESLESRSVPAPATDTTVHYTPLDSSSPLHAQFSNDLRAVLEKWSFQGAPGVAGALKNAGSAVATDTVGGSGEDFVIVRPRWQCGALGVRYDERALVSVLGAADSVHVATGYFNMPPALQSAMLAAARRAAVHVLTAAPTANGFFGARGVAGAIPLAYAELLRDYYEAARRAGVLSADPEGSPYAPGAGVFEWARKGWTFHGKGVWAWDAQSGAITTFAGSPNYGRRGVMRDIELAVEFTTRSSALVRAFSEERDALWSRRDATAVGAHLTRSHGSQRDVWSVIAHPDRALRWWPHTWARGVWIRPFSRILARFF